MNSTKRAAFEAALCTGCKVDVHVLASDGLDLPPSVELPALLQYGLDMPIPIPDIDAGPAGIRATLSFQRTPTMTFVPWESVAAIVARGRETFVASWSPAPAETAVEEPRRLRLVD